MRQTTLDKLEYVTELLAEGMSQKDIAEELGTTPSRVSQYVRQLRSMGYQEEPDYIAMTFFFDKTKVEELEEDPTANLKRIIYRFVEDLFDGDIKVEYGEHLPKRKKSIITEYEDKMKANTTPKEIVADTSWIDELQAEQHGAEAPINEPTSAGEFGPPDKCINPDCGVSDIVIYPDGKWECDDCLAYGEYFDDKEPTLK